MRNERGTAASAGVAGGPVFVLHDETPEVPESADPAAAVNESMELVKEDLKTLQASAEAAGRTEAAEILGAQALMADDPMLADAIQEKLDAGSRLGEAVSSAGADIAATLAAMDNEYLAARSADILEIADRLLYRLAGAERLGLSAIHEPCIVVAPTLTAVDTAALDPSVVLGFAMEQGGPTGHVAVIARSLGIPAVVGAAGLVEAAEGAATAAIDGSTGDVVFDPDAATSADYEERANRFAAAREAAAAYAGVAATFGTSTFRVAGNVGTVEDIEQAVAAGSDGVGLFRTEFLFLGRSEPPGEDEQHEVYARAAAAFTEPVVIRTLDIGGDKPAPYLQLDPEENPFLGERGIRLYESFPEVFKTQVRALLRAATEGDVWMMLPMVATLSDLEGALRLIESARTELVDRGVAAGDPKVGVMIEVPSAALIAEQLASRVDFFSIGTNDLTQYTLAADRTNGRLNAYADAAHPAVLQLCSMTAAAGRRHDISVAVCGAAGADPVTAVLFAAMGMDKLSVAPPSVNMVKALIDHIDPDDAADALEVALAEASAEAVRERVAPLLT